MLLVALIGACRRNPSAESLIGAQIVLNIDADQRVVDLGTEVVVESASFSADGVPDGSKSSNSFPVSGPNGVPWPITFTLMPRNSDFSRVVQLKVSLLAGTEVIAVLRAQASFVAEQSVELLLRFGVACLYEASLSCSEQQTCDAGSCIETGINPGQAPDLARETSAQKPASSMSATSRKDARTAGAPAPDSRAGTAGSPRGGIAGTGAAGANSGPGNVAGDPDAGAGTGDPAEPQPSSGTASHNDAVCGNGIIESGETCDPVDRCVTAEECRAADSCLRSTLVGSPATCNAACRTDAIEQCVSGDGCCPSDCSVDNDSDCSSSCGDGVVDAAAGERCEPGSSTQPCPTQCADGDACTRDYLTGSAENCNATCTSVEIVWPVSGDGCCPLDANASLDLDCEPICGNRIVEPGERCDGRCPSAADCDDGNPCTRDGLAGTGCDRHCTHLAIENLVAGDGCCPVGANANNDSDCFPVCGNRVIERGETCDGNCRVCADNDADPCTVVTMTGPECSPTCTRETITQTIDNDRCCPRGATPSADNDCQAAAPVCGNRRKEPGEDCDGSDCPSCDDHDVCTSDRSVPSPDACHPVCENTPKAPNSTMQDGCCPANADSRSDKDCAPPTPVCGNGIKEAGETCDPCPTECDDGKACTHDVLTGSGCNAACTHDPIAAGPMDGCCPRGETMESDPDCSAR